MKSSILKSNGDKRRDILFVHLTIHLFALIHSFLCFILRLNNIDDGIFLTILTLLMILTLINFFNGTTDVFVSLSLLSLLAGFYLGTKGADLIGLIIPNSQILTHVLATFLVTEFLGWLVFFVLRKRIIWR
ncbi:hypothetical protein MASR1M46_20640 [Bacteroidales bacterium]